jgi:protein gp37
MHPDWPIELAAQCEEYNVPCFFKQWGEWQPAEDVDTHFLTPTTPCHEFPDGQRVYRVGKKRAGRELLGRTWDQFPEVAHA